MSRELITKYPEVFDYTKIWMENITHMTARGSSEFGLTNTNKLLRSYDGCDGLKTGSTSKALFCVSATAERNGIRLISVIMAGPDSKTRFRNAAELLNYGFGSCRLYVDENRDALPETKVRGGVTGTVPCKYQEGFRYLDTKGVDFSTIEKEVLLEEELTAPIEKGEAVGSGLPPERRDPGGSAYPRRRISGKGGIFGLSEKTLGKIPEYLINNKEKGA